MRIGCARRTRSVLYATSASEKVWVFVESNTATWMHKVSQGASMSWQWYRMRSAIMRFALTTVRTASSAGKMSFVASPHTRVDSGVPAFAAASIVARVRFSAWKPCAQPLRDGCA